MHALEQFAQFVAIGVRLTQQGLPEGCEFDDQLELHLRRARAMQAILVDLPVEQHVHRVQARGDFTLAIIVGERHPEQRDRGHQRVDRLVRERRAQLQRLDLRAERARDDLGIFRVRALDQDVEVPNPVEDAPRRQRQPPDARIEPAVAVDPVDGEGTGEAALLVAARIAEVADPGEGLEIVEPVVMHHVDGKGRGAIGIDKLTRQQIAPLHHLEQGLAIGRAEVAERGAVVFVAGPCPNPADHRIADHEVGKALGALADSKS